MESIRQYAKGNAVRDRGKRVSIVRGKREKCDRCSSFLTLSPVHNIGCLLSCTDSMYQLMWCAAHKRC